MMMIQFNGDDSSRFDDGGDSSRFNGIGVDGGFL